MPASSKLKVYRTAIGFHDAYIAAPSQKAALIAWRSTINLFAQKLAEHVTEPALMAEPLTNPGKIIKRLRGTSSEQIAALGLDRTPRRKKNEVDARPDNLPDRHRTTSATKAKPERKREPKPDRAGVSAAEAALTTTSDRQAGEQRSLRERQAALDGERRDMERNHRRETDALEETRGRAEAAYEKAMKSWRS